MTRWSAGWWAMVAGLCLAWAVSLPITDGLTLLVVPILAYVATKRFVRARNAPPPPPPVPTWAQHIVQRPWWGYVIPWLPGATHLETGQPLGGTPGYVGISAPHRAPVTLPDGTLWLPRWDDDDHRAKRKALPLDYPAATLYELEGFVDEADVKVRWEGPTVRRLAAAGCHLTNVEHLGTTS